MKKLRLIVTYDCPKNCAGCCNKQSDFTANKVPYWDGTFNGYDQLIITGGEPMLKPDIVSGIALTFKYTNHYNKVYMYTSMVDDYEKIIWMLNYVDGITVTVHEQADIDKVRTLNFYLLRIKRWLQDNNKTLRLNVFKGFDVYMQNDSLWEIKKDIEWIDNCPLPSDEVLMRLKT